MTEPAGSRIVVTGGRDFADVHGAFDFLDVVHQELGIGFVGQGGARGADFLGKRWALDHVIPTQQFDADWERYGKRAGHLRNGVMLREVAPDWLVAFPGGRGTADCVAQAQSLGIRVLFFR